MSYTQCVFISWYSQTSLVYSVSSFEVTFGFYYFIFLCISRYVNIFLFCNNILQFGRLYHDFIMNCPNYEWHTVTVFVSVHVFSVSVYETKVFFFGLQVGGHLSCSMTHAFHVMWCYLCQQVKSSDGEKRCLFSIIYHVKHHKNLLLIVILLYIVC